MHAICFACTKFHQYIYGKCTDVQTDHRPLESISRKSIAKATYDATFTALHPQREVCVGKLMYVADTLACAFIRGEPSCGAPDDNGSARTQPSREPTSNSQQTRGIQAGHRRRPSDAVFETVHPTRVAETQICSHTAAYVMNCTRQTGFCYWAIDSSCHLY